MPDITYRLVAGQGGHDITGMATPQAAHAWPAPTPMFLDEPSILKPAALGEPTSTMGLGGEARALEPTQVRRDRITTTRIPPGSSRIGGPTAEWIEAGMPTPEPLSRSQFGPREGGPGFAAPEPPEGPPRLLGGPTRPVLPPAGEMTALPTGRLSPQFAEAIETVVAKL
jgi:hypothetical protein